MSFDDVDLVDSAARALAARAAEETANANQHPQDAAAQQRANKIGDAAAQARRLAEQAKAARGR